MEAVFAPPLTVIFTRAAAGRKVRGGIRAKAITGKPFAGWPPRGSETPRRCTGPETETGSESSEVPSQEPRRVVKRTQNFVVIQMNENDQVFLQRLHTGPPISKQSVSLLDDLALAEVPTPSDHCLCTAIAGQSVLLCSFCTPPFPGRPEGPQWRRLPPHEDNRM